MSQNDQTQYLKKSELKIRGWTDTAIKEFLREPDAIKPNPRYKKAAPVKLYNLERVKQVESSEAFTTWKNKTASQRLKAKQNAQKRIRLEEQKLLNWVNSLSIDIPKYEYSKLVKAACAHYNQRQKEKEEELQLRGKNFYLTPDDFAYPESDPNFLYRIIYNYLRHVASNYDYELTHLFRKIGKEKGYQALRNRFYDEIEKTYPDLEDFLYSQYQ